MTLRLSLGLRTALVPFATRAGYLTLYTGGQPPEVTSPPTGTQLCDPTPLVMEPAVDGQVRLTLSIPCVATAAGVAKWGRITPTNEDSAANTAINDFTVGGVGSGADVILSKTSLVVGDQIATALTISYGGA